MKEREFVFISHANPEDNDFALWLSSQLANAGYKVWSDVTKLVGGETFWDEIEEAIKEGTAKFIIAVSNNSQNKQGVLDEVHVAVSLERSEKLNDFVIPVKLDDISFNNFRANIARKNAIDFSNNWADGLSGLLQKLEKDNVPKCSGGLSTEITNWYHRKKNEKYKIENAEESYISNWLSISKLPERIYFYNLSVCKTQINKIVAGLGIPYIRHNRLMGCFASTLEIESLLGEIKAELYCDEELDAFLAGKSKLSIRSKEARNIVTNLLRQAWDNFAKSKGLISYDLADGAKVWYPKKGFVDNDKLFFTGVNDKRTYRQLVGKAKDLTWHFGIYAKPALDDILHYTLRPHIIFTEDGENPIDNKKRMHSLRCSTCVQWWNAKWRDLTLAYSNYLADGKDVIELPVSEFQTISLTFPQRMLSSVKLVMSENNTPDELNQYEECNIVENVEELEYEVV